MTHKLKNIIILVIMMVCLYISLPVSAAQKSTIDNCKIAGGQIEIDGSVSEKYQKETVHLLTCNVSEDIAQAEDIGNISQENGKFKFSTTLLDSRGSLRICQAFCLAVLDENKQLKKISAWKYVTNPDVLSQNAPARNDHGIKGILPASTDAAQFNDLGINQIMFNLELGQIVTKSKGKNSISYHYAGNDYYFSTKALEDYDRIFKWCRDNNFQLTVTLLNASSSKNTNLIHPDAKDSAAHPTYALNTSTAEGINQLRAVISFLANRYSGEEYGIVDNWILGNQVNARTEWYYLKSSDLDVNAKEYAKAFRITYNEIKAVNKNANVYISLDQEWNRKSNPGCFTSREFMSRFAYYIRQGGDIDWSLGIHPYDAPIYDPYAWLQQKEYVYNNRRSPYLTISNIDILIEEMKDAQYLNPNGQIRNIMLSQIGYSSAFGEELQAASIAYAYAKALQYPEIKGFILFRETDEENELSIKMAQGLKTLDGHVKLAYEYYKTAGTAAFGAYEQQFKETTGYSLAELLQKGTFYTRDEWLLTTRPEEISNNTEENQQSVTN